MSIVDHSALQRILPCDRREARRYLPQRPADEQEQFALRQVQARRRTTQLLSFYTAHPSRLARLHILASCAITLGRFAGFSQAFNDIGEAVMPVDATGRPRTAAWQEYARACRAGRPWPLRDERWLEAHMRDLEAVRRARLEQAFEAERAAQVNDALWSLLHQHMEVTLGTRLMDPAALAGLVAYETAFARTLGQALRQLWRAGRALLGRYAREATRALLLPADEPRRPLLSYRRIALELLRHTLTAWSARHVYRHGMRNRDRGWADDEDGWPLLAQVLGDKVATVHPLIVEFYTNPGRFTARASLDLHTLPARFLSRALTFLVGQGMCGVGWQDVDVRLRTFRRADGSMHWLREIYCGGGLRVFDSDFVVRQVAGRPRLFEVFVDQRTEVELEVTPLPNGGLSLCGCNLYVRGVRVPLFGLVIDFRSRVVTDAAGAESIAVDGHLCMRPRTALGRFLAHGVLRRPEHLACIHYEVRPGAVHS